MRFLFSSADRAVVESMGRRLNDVGIQWEIRYRPPARGEKNTGSYKELWVRTENELQWAIALLAMYCEVGRN